MKDKPEIRWSDTDYGDEEKRVIQGEITLPSGEVVSAVGLTPVSVQQKLAEKMLSQLLVG